MQPDTEAMRSAIVDYGFGAIAIVSERRVFPWQEILMAQDRKADHRCSSNRGQGERKTYASLAGLWDECIGISAYNGSDQ
jgi:hypothetical protein